MAYKYYLLNGKNGIGNALNILVDGYLKRDFMDIALLDLQTMQIPQTNAKDILQEYNPGIDLKGIFYDASYPHCQTKTKSYAAIFNFENEKVKYYAEKLQSFAEQRAYKKEHGQKIKLDESKELEDYMRRILYNILNGKESNLSNYESLMSAKLKDIINERYKNAYYMETNNYINSKIYILRNLLSNYTELRNLSLEYMLYIQKQNTNIRNKIKRTEIWNNNGMQPMMPKKYTKGEEIEKDNVYTQMELSDFIKDFPKKKTLIKHKND